MFTNFFSEHLGLCIIIVTHSVINRGNCPPKADSKRQTKNKADLGKIIGLKGMSGMYIIKNAFRCIGRAKGRNILIGIIVLVIAISACIGLSIRQAAQSAKEETLSGMSVTATISVDRESIMGGMTEGGGGGFDKDQFADMMGGTAALTLEEYQKYAAASSVKGFYYTITASLDGSDNIEAVSTSGSSSGSNEGTLEGGTGDFGGSFGGGGFGGRPGMMMSSGDFSITGYSSDSAMTSFINGTMTITDGAVFAEGTASYDCIISKELATYNDLSVGSVITLTNPENEEEGYDLTVVGIYSDSSSNEGFSMMRGSDPANNIYMSYTALNAIITASREAYDAVTDGTADAEAAITGTLSATYTFADTDDYYLFEEEARALGLSDTYSVSSQDLTAFENSLVPLNTLGEMAGWFLIIILIIGAIILVVLNIFNIRERKYEIGVLMAIGMKKAKVAMQFLIEAFAVTLAAVIIGIGVGAVSAVPVTNALLANQIESSQGQANKLEQSFGRGEMPDMGNMGNFGGGGFGGGMEPPSGGKFEAIGNIFGEGAANYVSEVNSAMNLTVVLQMLGIAILLTLIAGAASILFVMRYEPLKILSNRD